MTCALPAQRSQSLAQVASAASPTPEPSAFLRFKKIKAEATILAAAKHNLREIPCTPNISAERSHLNEVLLGPTTAKAVKAHFKAMLAAAGIKKLRKDAVLIIEAIVSLPAGVHDPDLQYFKASLAWIEERFGQGNILSATLHNDESAQHMHVLIVPLVNGAMNGSDLLGGPHHIKALQRHFRQAMRPALTCLDVQAANPPSIPSEEMAQATLAHLRNLRDPVFSSAIWQPIRDCIERLPHLFYEYLNSPPLLPNPSTGRAIRPRKRMPTMAEIFTRRVGTLHGSEVEKYRQSPEYLRAHAVHIRDSRDTPATQKNKRQAASTAVAPQLPAPPFALRTLCSVGFAKQQLEALPWLSNEFLRSPLMEHKLQVARLQKCTVAPDHSMRVGRRYPPALRNSSNSAARHLVLVAVLAWRWPAFWPRAPPINALLYLLLINGD